MKGVVGMFEPKHKGQKLQREDSSLKESMKAVMKRGRKFAPKMPKVGKGD
jgi:hypothetical protein